LYVVAPMHFSAPVDSAGLSRLDASDDGVNLVDEQDRLRIFGELLQHRFQALLEIAAVLGPRKQRAHVQGIDDVVLEELRNVALVDPPRETFGDRCLADAGLPDEQRVVLPPAAKHLDDPFELVLATDQRIDLAHLRQMVEVDGVSVERTGGLRIAVALFFRRLRLVRLLLRMLGDAVRDVIDHIQARDAALVQEINGVRLFFAEDGDQHVGSGDFLLAG
jgi:hypothetical protein